MMWGEGGRFCWGRTEGEGRREVKGIVVIFAWLSSLETHLKPYVDLYWSLGWRPLVCHVDFLTLIFPNKATSLACGVLDELVKILNGKMQEELGLDEYRLIRECICGQIYDSAPVDFTGKMATRFLHHHTAQRLFSPTKITSWMRKVLTSGLDVVLPSRSEAQRAEYWQSLYSSVAISMGPILIFSSEDDDLAPYQVIFNFSLRLKELGVDAKLVKWSNSPHVGHYSHHQTDYHSNVIELLGKAATIFSQRRLFNEGSENLRSSCNNISESICSLHETALSSNESLRRVDVSASDNICVPSSSNNLEVKVGSSLLDERKGNSFTFPSVNLQGVLSQVLFDVCVPKNVEGWDIKPVSLNVKQSIDLARGHGPSNHMRCIRCSRL
ncbi:hypothetical protein C4D60_Mb10t05920 [Musa balbisiana]|uniref:Uncharacterized protein n=1 Tax=Musa balbisiana TaxID=52838 RepID=A0A4S8IV30_MUSBA|nr:hypothetical protein C4D60_Mb10t05920 [Musa balbisiana]